MLIHFCKEVARPTLHMAKHSKQTFRNKSDIIGVGKENKCDFTKLYLLNCNYLFPMECQNPSALKLLSKFRSKKICKW